MILLSHFSSLLEVVTAIYISMCMDDVLRGVCSPKYYEDLAKALKDYYIEGHDELVNRIVETNREKADSISMYMKNRAAFLAVITMLFILLLGYESAYHERRKNFLAQLQPGEVLFYSYAKVETALLDRIENALIYHQQPRLNTSGKESYLYPDTEIDSDGQCALLDRQIIVGTTIKTY